MFSYFFILIEVILEVYWFCFLKSTFLFRSFSSLFLFSSLLFIISQFALCLFCLFQFLEVGSWSNVLRPFLFPTVSIQCRKFPFTTALTASHMSRSVVFSFSLIFMYFYFLCNLLRSLWVNDPQVLEKYLYSTVVGQSVQYICVNQILLVDCVIQFSYIALLIFSLVVLSIAQTNGVQVPKYNDGFVDFSFQISQILLPEFLRHRCLVFTHFELLMSSFWIDPFIIAVLSTLCNVNKVTPAFCKKQL